MGEVKRIPVKSEEEVWFLEKQINLFDILDFFPIDAVESANGHGKSLLIETDRGWSFVTDIEKGKFAFRKKSKSMPGTGKWVVESELKPGDVVCIEKLGSYHYRLFKESAGIS
ncbi:MAG: hypothetical protein HGB19_05855 [Chlorobiales bacterium]|nr:hypothetical protein [Chlorobiales bacterium]